MKLLNRKLTPVAAGMALMLAAAHPAQAATTVDIFGQIDAFNTIANPLQDDFGNDLTPGENWTGFGGLAVGNVAQMTVTYDEADVTGAAIEVIDFTDMSIMLFDAAGTSTLFSYVVDDSIDDDNNFLFFENGVFTGLDVLGYGDSRRNAEDTSDYLSFGGESYFSLIDFDSDDEILHGSWNFLPPVTTVPVPAAVWLFGSGLIGLVGVARRKA